MAAKTETSCPFRVSVAEDRLKAWLRPTAPARPGFAVPNPQDIIVLLEQAKIAITDDVRHRVDDFIAALNQAVQQAGSGAPKLPESFLIAQGRPATDAEDGRFEWAPELARTFDQPVEGEQIDYFSRNAIVTVEANTVIGRILAPRPGVSSLDVYGTERPPRKPKGNPFRLGAGVRLAEDGSGMVIATTGGRVAVEKDRVSIAEVLAIAGDVDFSTGSVDACVDVMVRGTVRAKFKVRTTKSLSVDRVIEAADVEVGGDIVVRGGIFGQDLTGRVRAGGNISAQLLNEIDLQAGGDVTFRKEVINSRVRCLGRLVGPRGTVIGGSVYAREGMEVRVIGSEAGVATSVTCGTDVNALRRARRIERQIKEQEKSANQIRQAIQPLVANLKRLSPAQRERATELLSKADEIELQVEQMRQQADQFLRSGAPRGKPSLLINEVAYPGTHIGIGARETRLLKPLYGPVRVELRKVSDVTEMVAINQRTGSVTVLASTEADLDAAPTDESPSRGKNDDAKQSADKRSAGTDDRGRGRAG